MDYHKHFSTRETPQSEPIPGTDQEQNEAGGFAWPVDDWTRLHRFLILGSEGGTYYTGERELTIDNATAVLRCIKNAGHRVVEKLIKISKEGRAPKNDPALFVLALCVSHGDALTKNLAQAALTEVARTGTHLFTFLRYVKALRGWGRGLRRAVAAWYLGKDPDRLAYQVVKYRQRAGYTHRDVLRLSHPKTTDRRTDAVFKFATVKTVDVDVTPQLILDFALLQTAKTAKEAIKRLESNPSLSWEMVPSDLLKSADVWAVLLPNLPMTALIRNLGRLSSIGLLTAMSQATTHVVERLTNPNALQKSRVHPIQALSALMVYRSGHGARGALTWDPVGAVIDALDECFYLSFGNVEPTGKRYVLALDVSGSMRWHYLAGVPGLTPREGAAAMALVTARTEASYEIIAFSHAMVPLTITGKTRLDDALKACDSTTMGGTDCALPMIWAAENGVEADAFVIYTDNQTWAGRIHPAQALREYRQETGKAAKLVVVGMESNGFSIADPNDGGMLDVVGFDTATPNVIGDFCG